MSTTPEGSPQLEALVRGKEHVRPILLGLAPLVEQLGDDVVREQRETEIVFARRRAFALLRAATETRLDVGLVLPGVEETERLRPAGEPGITHLVSLGHEEEIDAELVEWLRAAYDAAAG